MMNLKSLVCSSLLWLVFSISGRAQVAEESVQCQYPETIENGRIVIKNTTGTFPFRTYFKIKQGADIEYQCEAGYRIEGPSGAACLGGVWSPELMPECRPVYCPYPGRIRNGKVLLVGVIGKYEYRPYVRRVGQGLEIEYQCNDGYRIKGPLNATCSDGVWSPDIKPVCKPVYCPYPGTIEHGKILLIGVIGKYEYRPYVRRIVQGQEIEYQCNDGYRTIGPTNATCSDGQWSPDIKPECEPVYCPYPGTIEHGKILLIGVIGKYEYRPYVRRIVQGQEIEYQCDDGYRQVGPAGATCLNEVWRPEIKPECVEDGQ